MGLDDAELVAAETGHGVAEPHDAGEPFGDLADQLVAGGMAVGVVDGLEAVEVDQQHGKPGAGAAEQSQFLVEPEIEGTPVRQQRELVLSGEPLDLLLAQDDLGCGAAQAMDDEGEDRRRTAGRPRRAPRGTGGAWRRRGAPATRSARPSPCRRGRRCHAARASPPASRRRAGHPPRDSARRVGRASHSIRADSRRSRWALSMTR